MDSTPTALARRVADPPQRAAELSHRHCACFLVRRQKRRNRLLVRCDRGGAQATQAQGAGQPDERRRSRRRVVLGQGDRAPEVPFGGFGVELERAVAGQEQEAGERRLEPRALVTGCPCQLERLLVVVDEDLRLVGEPLLRRLRDPVGGREVLVGSR